MTRPFHRLLIANRGEIAARVIRSAHALGFETVAVYSAADRDAPYVRLADQAVEIGPAPAAQSYLSVDRLIAAARRTGADAIHPGYGFLAESAAFATACEAHELVFVGPTAATIALMGDKGRARRAMAEAGLPVVPGYDGAANDASLIAAARALGFPLLVKAAAGGGGRGMRRVDTQDALPDALQSARAEALAAFGDGRLLLERHIQGARHIEIQVLCDTHGAALHIGERDCSVQRRYQKVIEEAPSPAVDSALRARLGQAAARAARSVGYVGAGTVELLLAPDHTFYFLEMNTRLQVEHPVTELVYGVDLVALQLQIAAGEPLTLPQDAIRPRGHAIEARLYAEDPAADFAPQAGPILLWEPPPSLRTDSAIASGQTISAHYDPLLAKLIATGPTRQVALRRLARGLQQTTLLGLRTNRAFLHRVLRSPDFQAGAVHTGWLEQHPALQATPSVPDLLWALAAALHAPGDGWRTTGPAPIPLTLRLDTGGAGPTEPRALTVTVTANGVETEIDGATYHVDILDRAEHPLRVVINGLQRPAAARFEGHRLHLSMAGHEAIFVEPIPTPESASEAHSGDLIAAPFSGSVVSVVTAVGQPVHQDQVALTLEAMKIQSPLRFPRDGQVAELCVSAGATVTRGQVLVRLAPADITPPAARRGPQQ